MHSVMATHAIGVSLPCTGVLRLCAGFGIIVIDLLASLAYFWVALCMAWIIEIVSMISPMW